MAPLISETLSSVGDTPIDEDGIILTCPHCHIETPASAFTPLRSLARTIYNCPKCKRLSATVVDPAVANAKEANGAFKFGQPKIWLVQPYGGMVTQSD